jgi:hypothetical protein
MFRCDKCNAVVKPGTPTRNIIVQERTREYPERSEPISTRAAGRWQRHRTIDKGGAGHEIVRELKVCPACAEEVVGAGS